jgi:hypothetical protein
VDIDARLVHHPEPRGNVDVVLLEVLLVVRHGESDVAFRVAPDLGADTRAFLLE